MTQNASGTLLIEAGINGITSEFLLDTGAGLVTLSEKTFADLKPHTRLEYVRQMGARLANNLIQRMDVYRLEQFSVGDCELGPIEVAVIKGGSRNLLGLSALTNVAPFAISMGPPSITLSNCDPTTAQVAGAF